VSSTENGARSFKPLLLLPTLRKFASLTELPPKERMKERMKE
jgi:hypothetical protein